MKKIYLLIVFCCMSIVGFSATWYSQGATAVTTLGNWNSLPGGGGATPANFTTAADIWVVQTNMNIGAAATWTIAGSLQINTGSRIGKPAAAGTSTINIGGNFTMAGSANVITAAASVGNWIFNVGGNLSLTGTSVFTYNGTGFMFINFNGGTTFATPQTVTWTSTGASTRTNLTVNAGSFVQLLSNVVCPAASSTGITVNGTLICGTFAMTTVAANQFNINAASSFYTASPTGMNGSVGTGFTMAFSGAANYIFNSAIAAQTTGTFLPAAIASGGSVTIDNLGAVVTGVTLSQPTTFALGAALNLEAGKFTNTAANLSMAAGSNVNRDNGILAVTPTTYSGVNLTYMTLGVNTAAVTTGNEWPAAFTGNVTVNKTGATITLNGNKADVGPITITSGTLDASASNFNISLTGTWTNNAGFLSFTARTGTVTFNGSTAQTLTGSAATTFYNLTLNNATGLTLGAAETVNNTLTLTSGRVTLGANNLILGTTATAVAGTLSSANMVVATGTGALRKNMAANGSFLYPVGDAVGPNYTPITLNFTAGTYGAGATTAVTLRNVKQPNNANVTNYINRYWTVSTSVAAAVYSVSATYVPADVVGTEANISMGEYTGALPWLKFGATTVATHTLTGGATVSGDFSGISTAGPTGTATASLPFICAGTPTSLSVVAPTGDPTLTYSWAPTASLSSPTGTPVTATPSVTTTYTLTITDGNGFTSTATTFVSVNPVPGIISGTQTVCVGLTTTLSDTPTGGLWTSVSGNASIGSLSGAVLGVSVGTATISYNAGGCFASTIVTVVGAPAGISGLTSVCMGNTITLADVTPGGVWSSTAGSGVANVGTGGVVSGVSAGTATISYTTPSCNPATYVVTVNAYPTGISGASAVCVGGTITLSDVSPGGSWGSTAPLTASVDPTGLVSGEITGSATISYTIAGCAVNHVITVNPLPAGITGPASVCIGYSVTLTDLSGGGTWSSSSPTVGSIDPVLGNLTGVGTGATNIIYTITSTGCSTSVIETVYANPAPITGANSVCLGATTALTDAAGTSGSWSSSFPAIGSVGATTGIVAGVSLGTTTISYTLITTGCFVIQPMTVNPNPAAITGSPIVCAGSTVTLADGTPGGSWSSSAFWLATVGTDGVVSGITGGGTTTISYTLGTGCYNTFTETIATAPTAITGDSTLCITYSTLLSDSVSGGTWSSSAPGSAIAGGTTGNVLAIDSGIVTIFYTITGCAPVAHNITINPIPAAITGVNHLCDGVTANLYDFTTGGIWSSTDTSTAKIDSFTGVATGMSLGTTSISYILTTGCYVVIPVTVNPLAPPIAGTDTICATGSVWLTDIVGGGTWSSSNPAVGTITPVTGLLTGLATGITYIVYTLPTGCTASLLETAIAPVPAISSPAHVCTGSVLNLGETETGGTWSSSNNYIASVNDTSGVLAGLFPGTVDITYTISAFKGCYATKSIVVNPLPMPVISFDFVSHTVSTYTYYTSYQWYNDRTGAIPGATGATLVLPFANDSVSVTVTDTNGCTSSSSWYFHDFTGVKNVSNAAARIYPNPASATLFIDAAVKVRAVISGIDGKVMLEQADAKEMDINALAPGMYLIALYNDDGQRIMVQKIVKE